MSPRNQASRIEGAVMAWTVLTTVFLWTPTMRGLFRPDISTWAVLDVEGSGRSGSFWLFPTLAAVALLIFYLYGHNRLRPLFQTLLIGWHSLLTFIVVTGVIRKGGTGFFEGAMWGIRIPLSVLVIPFAGFLVLAITWIARERSSPHPREETKWTAVDLRALALAVLLLPVTIVLFRVGDGIDWPTRFATAATILQWILLTQALSNPEPHNKPRAESQPDTSGTPAEGEAND